MEKDEQAGIGKLAASHAINIGRVKVGFVFSAQDLDPQQITDAVGIPADKSARRGDERRPPAGSLLPAHAEGFWKFETEGKVFSKDIDDHFDLIFERLLSRKDFFLKLKNELDGKIFFEAFWESKNLYAGGGPALSARTISGIAQFEAGLRFDIYQLVPDTK